MAGIFSAVGGVLVQTGEQALGYGVGQALSRGLEPEATQLAQAAWQLNTSLAIDPQTAAMLVRLGVLTADEGAAEAAQYGVSGPRFTQLVDGTRTPPDVGSLLTLSQRGQLDAGQLSAALLAGGVDGQYVDLVASLAQALLSAADVAMARQQGFIDQVEQQARAAAVGMTATDADLMFELAGLPPGITEGLELLRRGFIDEARFAMYVREGHTKTKYTQDLLNLLWTPLSASVAAEALIRERISEADAVAIAAKNGIAEQDFLLWSNMLGRPPGIGEALTLVNRGEMDDAGFTEVVARSDVRTEYAPQLLKLRVHYPPLFQVERAVTAGAVTDAVATDTLLKEGYTAEWVDAIVKAGHATKTAKHKDLALGIVESLFDAGLENEATTQTAIEALGYDPAEAAELLELHEARQFVSALTQAVGVVRARYVNHQVDEQAARIALDQLGLETDTKARLLDIWTAERGANVRTLTPAQVGQALKYGIFTPDEAVARWQQLGYSAADAQVYAEIINKGALHPLPVAG